MEESYLNMGGKQYGIKESRGRRIQEKKRKERG
jgi:hypothetical protein